MTTIGVLVATYNRKNITIRCLHLLHEAAQYALSDITTVVFDDGSTDGTIEAIENAYLDLDILHGSGNNYWAKSMAKAEKHIIATKPDVEYILWLNDDVQLDADSLERLVQCAKQKPDAITIGTVRDPSTGLPTYGGFRQSKWAPLKLAPVVPTTRPQNADTFNGNLLLVPISIAMKLGGIDDQFAHALADIDYGLRARQQGISRIVAPGTFGTCARNPQMPWLGVANAWKTFTGIKGGGHRKSLIRILRRLRPRTWRIYFSLIYLKWFARTGINVLKNLPNSKYIFRRR